MIRYLSCHGGNFITSYYSTESDSRKGNLLFFLMIIFFKIAPFCDRFDNVIKKLLLNEPLKQGFPSNKHIALAIDIVIKFLFRSSASL